MPVSGKKKSKTLIRSPLPPKKETFCLLTRLTATTMNTAVIQQNATEVASRSIHGHLPGTKKNSRLRMRKYTIM